MICLFSVDAVRRSARRAQQDADPRQPYPDSKKARVRPEAGGAGGGGSYTDRTATTT
jgi:hypothetical protein